MSRVQVSVSLASILLTLPSLAAVALGSAAATDQNGRGQNGLGALTVEPAIVDLGVAALILSGQQGGALQMAAAAIPWPAADGEANTTVVVEIAGDNFSKSGSADGGPATAVEVYVYAVDRDGVEVLDQASGRLILDRSFHPELVTTGLKVLAGLRLPDGRSQVRVLVRHADALGLRHTWVTQPERRASGPAVTALYFSDPRPWLEAAIGGPVPGESRVPGYERRPPGLPVLSAGRSGEALLLVRRPPPDPWSLRATWSREGSDEILERRAMTASDSFKPTSVGDGEDYRMAAVSFEVPELPPGRYRLSAQLRFLADGAEVEAAVSEPVTVFIEKGADGAGERVTRAGDTRRREVDALPRKAAREIERRYLAALALLAEGDEDGALEALYALESSAVESLAENAFSALEASQTRALLALPDRFWQAALPVLWLHARAAGESRWAGTRQGQRYDLREHARKITAALAEAYVRHLASEEARREAAWVLTDLAARSLERGSLRRAKELLSHTLEIRGDDREALLLLAALHEKSGRTELAESVLETLVAAHPADPEGWLRLALNRRRTGDVAGARQILRELFDDPATPGWIARLTCQELARIQLDAGELDQASTLLRRGLQRWPGNASLTIELAYVLESQDERQAASELLASIGVPTGAAAAERSRYNRWPLEAVKGHRQELAQLARQRLDDLATALRAER